uniref:Transmembrane protein n=2 Tax=Bursaphelenchus xylophilus TaxID=6326 RepID=A0A1I7SUQ2_BURXY
MNNIRLPTAAGGRPRTPARPLYAARLPPIHHPLGAPNSPRAESPEDVPKLHTSISEPVISMPQIPKLRPTTGRPAGTMLSATSTMGHSGNSAKPLPSIAEPSRRPAANDKPNPPAKVALKCAVIIIFLSIPILIFVLMMVMSGGFEPTPLDHFDGANETLASVPDSTLAPLSADSDSGSSTQAAATTTTPIAEVTQAPTALTTAQAVVPTPAPANYEPSGPTSAPEDVNETAAEGVGGAIPGGEANEESEGDQEDEDSGLEQETQEVHEDRRKRRQTNFTRVVP